MVNELSARSPSPPRLLTSPRGAIYGPLLRSLAWNQEWGFTFPDRALRRHAVQCPFSEACWISELREYGYARPRNAFLRAHPSVSVVKGARFLSPKPRLRRLRCPGEQLRAEPEALISVADVVQADPEELPHPRWQVEGGREGLLAGFVPAPWRSGRRDGRPAANRPRAAGRTAQDPQKP